MTIGHPYEDKSGQKLSVESGADVFIEVLNANGVKVLFINSGTDTFPIQETIAKFEAQGKIIPRVVLCPDEATAVAAAHGYFVATREVQVVLVHVDAGTLNLGGNMHDAQRGRAGIVVCAGRAPMTFEGEMPGTRSMNIHWTQEQLDQAGILRNFTKWDYETRRPENIQHVIQRAFQVASSEPPGPVYVTMPREVLMEKITEVVIPSANRFNSLVTPQADASAIEEIADALINARSPLIITGQSGRNYSTVDSMIELAETVGSPVVSEPVHMNFPSTHPMYAGINSQPYIETADVILSVDQDVPYIPANGSPMKGAKIFHIDIDPIKPTIPLWVFPYDHIVHADSSKAIPLLIKVLNRKMGPSDSARVDERYQLIRESHEKEYMESIHLAQSHEKNNKITPEYLSYCINEMTAESAAVIDECVTNGKHVSNYVRRSKPGTYFKSGGSSLGWGLGAAMGIKLADQERMVIATVGDGAFIYGCPTSTLWASDVYNAPFLTIIYNNQIHNAPRESLNAGYPDSYAKRTNNWVGMGLGPSVDFALLAKACRAYGETVVKPLQVRSALMRGLSEVRSGRSAVIDVRLEMT